MLYNDEVIRTAPCELLLHTVNASYNDQGLYACRAQSGSESPVVEKIGNMTVIGKKKSYLYFFITQLYIYWKYDCHKSV